QRLFTYEGANVLFAHRKPVEGNLSFVERLGQRRRSLRIPGEAQELSTKMGERFVKGFLRYVLDPGTEHGYGSAGRNRLNAAHIYLAALLEMQQLGQKWKTRAFCRTIFTTNFDTLLQNALQMVNLLYRITDRPEKGLDNSEFHREEGPIHLVYTHGSILRHNPASTVDELGELESQNINVLHRCLESHDVIIIGYGGWNDGLMAALRCCNPKKHMLYWCDIDSQPTPHVATFLEKRAGGATYVQLGGTGADGLMQALYEALVPVKARREPMQRYREWYDLVWNRKGSSNQR
ncbi:MAG: SIR2 family protein, partial [Anaerolineales bacterium]